MKLADLLVDLAGVVAASRSVASKHAALRARQLEAYSRSSSILREARKSAPSTAVQHDQSVPTASEDAPGSPTNAIVNSPAGSGPVAASEVSAQAEGAYTLPPPGAAFRPAPWASLASSASPASSYVDLQPQLRRGRLILPSKPDGGGATASVAEDLPPGIDLNIFRSSRTAEILKPPAEGVEQQDVLGEVETTAAKAMEAASALGNEADAVIATAKGLGHRNPHVSSHTRPKDFRPREPPLHPTNATFPATVDNAVAGGNEQLKAHATEGLEEPQSSRAATEGSTDGSLSKEDEDLAAALVRDQPAATPYQLRESRVPASRLSRLWNYSGLAAGMFAGAIGEGLSRATGGGGQGSVMLSAGNMERLVAKLSRMRGAALKIGQMVSFQDSKMLPAPIQEVLQRVQDRADYMPAWQRDRVLTANLGVEWRDLFDEFVEKPMAAASIGQVHRATLKSNGAQVAVKIQFPGVANSINSDLDNLGMLLAATRLLPKGLYLNKTIDNARTELAWECDYEREAECAERYRTYLADETDTFVVPKIYKEACGKEVLTMEYMEGVGVTRVTSFNQEQRDWIGTQLLRLCLREITEFRFMQTDPNWTNFLYNAKTCKLELLDFGASREFPERFIHLYVRLLEAASRSDRDAVKQLSEELGYLTGHESKTMVDAHVKSVLTLAEPFTNVSPEVYDFRDQTITERVKALIPVMLRERLAPPPEETYSLHRKLSGAFLLCARLGSRVRCRELFSNSMKKVNLQS